LTFVDDDVREFEELVAPSAETERRVHQAELFTKKDEKLADLPLNKFAHFIFQ